MKKGGKTTSQKTKTKRETCRECIHKCTWVSILMIEFCWYLFVCCTGTKDSTKVSSQAKSQVITTNFQDSTNRRGGDQEETEEKREEGPQLSDALSAAFSLLLFVHDPSSDQKQLHTPLYSTTCIGGFGVWKNERKKSFVVFLLVTVCVSSFLDLE